MGSLVTASEYMEWDSQTQLTGIGGILLNYGEWEFLEQIRSIVQIRYFLVKNGPCQPGSPLQIEQEVGQKGTEPQLCKDNCDGINSAQLRYMKTSLLKMSQTFSLLSNNADIRGLDEER